MRVFMVKRTVYMDRIRAFLDKPVIKVITGMRRCGKSTLMRLMIEELLNQGIRKNQILYINKESLEFDDIRDYQGLYSYIKHHLNKQKGKNYIFIDEIQEIEGWEKAAASILADKKADLIITGSNAGLLSSELATLITGRYVEIPVYPLSFDEFVQFRRKAGSGLSRREWFQEYLRYGGMPGLHAMGWADETLFQYLESIFSTIVLKDVIGRNQVRDSAALENITRFLFDNCGNISTAKRISDYLKNMKSGATIDTVQNYMRYLEAAFLLRRVRRFDIKGLKTMEIYDKFYMGDIGLRHAFIGYKDQDISGLLENTVCLELLKRGYHLHTGRWDDYEIDFIAEKNKNRVYIQVCYLLSGSQVYDREFGALEKPKDHYPRLVLSLDEAPVPGRNGIRQFYLPDFLLGTAGNDILG